MALSYRKTRIVQSSTAVLHAGRQRSLKGRHCSSVGSVKFKGINGTLANLPNVTACIQATRIGQQGASRCIAAIDYLCAL